MALGRVTGGIEWTVALLLTGAALILHVTTFRHQGALWRDEANAVEMGRMAVGEAWHNIGFDSILLGPILLLRAMTLAGLSGNDTALRALGLTLGVLALAALWWGGLRLSGRPPLVALVLFGLSPIGVRYGDSLRAYPLATLTILTTYVAMALVVRHPTRRAVVLASLAAAVAAQCSYLNSVLIAGLCAGGLASTVQARDLRRMALSIVPGFAGAVSLLVYYGRMQATWGTLDVQRRTLRFEEVIEKARITLMTPAPMIRWLWLAASLVAVVSVIYRVRARASKDGVRDLQDAAFHSTAAVVAVLLYLTFLTLAGVEPFRWHFTPLLAFVALSLDRLVRLGGVTPAVRLAFAGAAALGALAVFPEASRFVRSRHTNIDRVAAAIEQRATAGDLVVVSPYHCGVSFQRYYHGAADWTTLPPVDDHRVHRYDLLKAAMESTDAIAPVIDRTDAVLRAGHRVFIVVNGSIFQNPPSRPELPKVPDPDRGWHAGKHLRVWALQFGYYLQTHAIKGEQIPISDDRDVSGYEQMLLMMIEGYARR